MKIENLSIKRVTVAIFVMIGVVATILSMLAGSYFKQAAMEAQVSSLSRVIEVASQEMLKKLSQQNFELGMKLGHNKRLRQALQSDNYQSTDGVYDLLDDPFINGFPGFSEINLVKLRLYSLDLELYAESREGVIELDKHLPEYLATQITKKTKTERLKATDALWLSTIGPLYSTIVPVGGLRAVGYLEIVTDPAFNLADIGNITQTPVSIVSLNAAKSEQPPHHTIEDDQLPVTYILKTSDGLPAFEITGYEDVSLLSKTMEETQLVTISGFLLLTLSTLFFAVWLFNRFLFKPIEQVIDGMRAIANGKLNVSVQKTGLKEFVTFADGFEQMSNQIKIRTTELERLLNSDNSAIICFGHEGEAIYLNKAASELLGYPLQEIQALEIDDLFHNDVTQLMDSAMKRGGRVEDNIIHTQLESIRKDGQTFLCDAVINPLDDKSGRGSTVVLNPIINEQPIELNDYVINSIEKNEQRMLAVEDSVNTILEIAKNNPGLISELNITDKTVSDQGQTADEKGAIRELSVSIMNAALTCWEHDIGSSKLKLAEESGIWPVYLDKSTPTTRTLDKYLNIESCPKNPRYQRVIDTAEFVLKSLNKQESRHRILLEERLSALRIAKTGA